LSEPLEPPEPPEPPEPESSTAVSSPPVSVLVPATIFCAVVRDSVF